MFRQFIMTGSYPVFVPACSWLIPLYVNKPANYRFKIPPHILLATDFNNPCYT